MRASRLRLRCCVQAPLVIAPEGIKATDIEQGALGDCWFLSALAVLARKRAAGVAAAAHQGGHLGWGVPGAPLLQRDLDHRSGGRLLPRGRRPPDAALLPRAAEPAVGLAHQKAYAKLHGSYNAMGGGYAYQGMADLTGAPCERIDFQDGGHRGGGSRSRRSTRRCCGPSCSAPASRGSSLPPRAGESPPRDSGSSRTTRTPSWTWSPLSTTG